MIVQELLTTLREMLASGAITPDSDIRAYRSIEEAAGGYDKAHGIRLTPSAETDALVLVLLHGPWTDKDTIIEVGGKE